MNSSEDSLKVSAHECKVEPPRCPCVFLQPCLQAQTRGRVGFKPGLGVFSGFCFPGKSKGEKS